MTYRHLLMALGAALVALIIRILGLAPTLNWLTSLVMMIAPGAVAAWTLMLGGVQTTRWRLRHSLGDEIAGEELDHLDRGLQFLVQNARIVILEASQDGLFLEVPEAFAGYIERLIPGILPGGRLARQRITRVAEKTKEKAKATPLKKQTLGERWPALGRLPAASLSLPSFLAKQPPREKAETEKYLVALEHPSAELLLWGLQQERRKMRVCLIQSITGQLIVTAAVHLQGDHPPPGRWREIPSWPFLKYHTFGTPLEGRISDVIPRARGASVYSAQTRLLYLPPPAGYMPRGRILGTSVDGTGNANFLLTAPYNSTVLSINATEGFLDRQIRNDTRQGKATVVVSSHRALLKKLAEKMKTHVLVDMENAIEGGHIPIVTYAESESGNPDLTVSTVLDFLAEQGLDQSRPQILEFAHHIVKAVVEAARVEERDAGLWDLCTVSRGPNSLYNFLSPRAHYWQSAGMEYLTGLVELMRDDLHDFQIMAMLDALRTALNSIYQVGTLHHIAQQPFPSFEEVLRKGGALMCVLHDRDFPENDRYLRAMFEMAALRAVQMTDVPVSVHLHEPAIYSSSTSLNHWLKLARDGRVSLLIDLSEREWLNENGLRENNLGEQLLSQIETRLLFRCPEILADHLVAHTKGWNLPCPLTELAEMPDDTALAHLPDNNSQWFTATLRALT